MVVVGQEGWNAPLNELREFAGEELNRLHFMGRVIDEELPALYGTAICTVFPSLAEGFGLPIIELLSCGTPVVTSNSSSMKEIAVGGSILVDPLRPEEIAKAVTLIASDRKLRAELSHEVNRCQADKFSWSRCSDEHVVVFLGVVDRELPCPPKSLVHNPNAVHCGPVGSQTRLALCRRGT